MAVSLFVLAPYVALESLRTLMVEYHAETSIVGIVLTTGTLAICPWLGIAKQKIGGRLGSLATKGEGKQNLLCAGLAVGVLVGLLANTTLGIWWLDPAVGLVIAIACVLAWTPVLAGRELRVHTMRDSSRPASILTRDESGHVSLPPGRRRTGETRMTAVSDVRGPRAAAIRVTIHRRRETPRVRLISG